MEKYKKILLVLAGLIIVAGIVVTAVFGLNKGFEYSDLKQIQIYCATDVNIEDIREITNVVFGKERVALQKVELFNDEISITAKEISAEQVKKVVEFTNQEYGVKNSAEDINIRNLPAINIMDTVKPYILPIIMSLAVLLVYIGVKYRKQGVLKSVFKTLGIVILVEAIYYSLIAITRMPINRYSMPLGLAILLVTLTIMIYKLEKK